jgi:AcrR family transcriptional regulator
MPRETELGRRPTMGKPTSERILDAAETIFAERGFDATSLADVTDCVGIRGPSLYNHFKSKRELYIAVLSRLLNPFFALLDELAARPASRARAEAAVEAMLRHHVAQPNLARLIQHAILAGGDQLDLLVTRWYRPFFERIPQLMPEAEEGAATDLDQASAMLMGFNAMILGYVTLAPLHDQLFGRDLFSEEQIQAYNRFMRQLA